MFFWAAAGVARAAQMFYLAEQEGAVAYKDFGLEEGAEDWPWFGESDCCSGQRKTKMQKEKIPKAKVNRAP